jgi:hypothetical protein
MGLGPTRIFCENRKIRDMVITLPSLGHEAVRIFSTLREEKWRPRRCGRIAGCPAFHLPQGACARLFAGGDRTADSSLVGARLVQPSLVAEPYHFLNEHRLLLVVEASE